MNGSHSEAHGAAQILEQQKAAAADTSVPDRRTRIDRLDRLHNAILAHREDILAAIDADFSGRAEAESELVEVFPLLESIAYHRKRLGRWMRPRRRSVPLSQWPARARLHFKPLGVIGIVVPWNFPVLLALSPLIGALAAGNRAMIKVSEHCPRTGEVLDRLVRSAFDPSEVAVVQGGVDVARAFTALPFDHIVFTGSTRVARHVMEAAAAHLTPLTLELGGKSPAIIHESFPADEAARRIAFGKAFNGGQACVAPDYVLIPPHRIQAFCKAFESAIRRSYPAMRDNPDYTSLISGAHKERAAGMLRDASDHGASLVTIQPDAEDFDGTNKLPVTLVLNATPEMAVMQEELFAPILPVVSYDSIDEAIAFVESRPAPLAMYYFDWDRDRAEDLLHRTRSGGACVNETMTHVLFDDLPFGGVGPSGMGHYHGEEGFRTFSKARAVVSKGRLHPIQWIAAPWGRRPHRWLRSFQMLRFRPRRTLPR